MRTINLNNIYLAIGYLSVIEETIPNELSVTNIFLYNSNRGIEFEEQHGRYIARSRGFIPNAKLVDEQINSDSDYVVVNPFYTYIDEEIVEQGSYY